MRLRLFVFEIESRQACSRLRRTNKQTLRRGVYRFATTAVAQGCPEGMLLFVGSHWILVILKMKKYVYNERRF